jgi:ABC-type uncharacterized transport system substrate-binding protein
MVAKVLGAAGLGLAALPFFYSTANAHPHIWADVVAHFLYSPGGEVTGAAETWIFDVGYSSFATEGLDTNHDGKLSAEELQGLVDANMTDLTAYHYFTSFFLHEQLQNLKGVDDAKGSMAADGRFTLSFNAMLQQPVNPHDSAPSLKVYDPSFFIDMEFVADQVLAANADAPKNCHVALSAIPADQTVDLTRAMLATHGPDWKPDSPTDYGSLFARTLMLAC